MANCLTPGRKDDLESLIYILCFLFAGKFPIIEYIFNNYDNIKVDDLTRHILEIRIQKRETHLDWIKENLPLALRPCFEYVKTLHYRDRPNYNLVKLWLTPNSKKEGRVWLLAKTF